MAPASRNAPKRATQGALLCVLCALCGGIPAQTAPTNAPPTIPAPPPARTAANTSTNPVPIRVVWTAPAPPKRMKINITVYDNLNSNAIHAASFTTQYRANCYVKTEITEE